jgi:hypothetical protein
MRIRDFPSVLDSERRAPKLLDALDLFLIQLRDRLLFG